MKLEARTLLWSLYLCLSITACATTTPPTGTLADPHRQKAAALEAEGALRPALNEWTVSLTIDPKDAAAMQGKKRVEERISQAVSERLTQGREALKRGAHLEARRHFLATLALDPANKAAFDLLQTEAKEVRVLNHTVRSGETLASIAELFYADRSRSEVIWETNQLPANPKLAPGLVLKIPEIPGLPFRQPQAIPREARPSPVPSDPKKPQASEEELIDIHPLLAEAREALERKDFQSALAGVDRFLAQNPRNAEGAEVKKTVLYQQGKVLLEQKKYTESLQALNQLAKLSPNYQDASALLGRAKAILIQEHYNEGIRLYREEKVQGAVAEWRIVLQIDPNHNAAKKNIEQAEQLLKGLQQRQQKK